MEDSSNTIKTEESQEVNPIKRDDKGRWVKGNPPGPGRPKGITMKEYAREYLAKLSDKEKDEWLDGLSKEIVWKMAEGNPHNTNELEVGIKPSPLLDAIRNNNSSSQDKQTNEEN